MPVQGRNVDAPRGCHRPRERLELCGRCETLLFRLWRFAVRGIAAGFRLLDLAHLDFSFEVEASEDASIPRQEVFQSSSALFQSPVGKTRRKWRVQSDIFCPGVALSWIRRTAMAQSRCPKCLKTEFELKESTPVGSRYKLWMVQGTEGGQPWHHALRPNHTITRLTPTPVPPTVPCCLVIRATSQTVSGGSAPPLALACSRIARRSFLETDLPQSCE